MTVNRLQSVARSMVRRELSPAERRFHVDLDQAPTLLDKTTGKKGQ
jgi:hypothetical protein